MADDTVAALAAALAIVTTLSIVLATVLWRVHDEHPGLLSTVLWNSVGTCYSRRVLPDDRSHSQRKPGAEVALVVPRTGSGSSSDLERGGGGGRPSRRRSATHTKPVLDENVTYEWEIDPRRLRKRTQIGRGNFGEVWLATWLGSPVAVKTMLAELQAKDRLVKRFIDEILLMSTLHHPNVVMFLGACTRRPNLCLVLEYCQHGSLHHFLKAERDHGISVTMSLLYRFALDIARGVYYLHKRCNVVQRDLKARNILVDESLNAKVADFGLSRIMDDGDLNKLTACGTPAWTAPEIVKMERYTDKVDVYSFAIIMWELITRQEPYGGQKGVQIAYAAAEQGLRPEIPEYCPEEYAELMRQCWADKPDDRPTFQTILKRLFQLKKSCDVAAANSLNASYVPTNSDLTASSVDGDDAADERQRQLLATRIASPAAGRVAVHASSRPAAGAAIAISSASPPSASSPTEAHRPQRVGFVDAPAVRYAPSAAPAADGFRLIPPVHSARHDVAPHGALDAHASGIADVPTDASSRMMPTSATHTSSIGHRDATQGSAVDFAALGTPTGSRERVVSAAGVQDAVDLGIVDARRTTPAWDGDVSDDAADAVQP